MSEKLLSISEVNLYGQVVTDMAYIHAEKEGDPNRQFARIFGYGYEGRYYNLDAPILMLIDGGGDDVSSTSPPKEVVDSFSTNMRVWTVDKSDSSIRLDTLTGSFEEILLEVELGNEMGSVSGGRVSGGRVSGGRVSGGRVSGGRVSGGRVSGGKAD